MNLGTGLARGRAAIHAREAIHALGALLKHDPSRKEQIAQDDDFAPLRKLASYKKLIQATP